MPQKHVPDATRLHRSKSMPMRIASSQRKTSNDVLDRLEKIIEQKKKAHPEWLLPPKQPTEHVKLDPAMPRPA